SPPPVSPSAQPFGLAGEIQPFEFRIRANEFRWPVHASQVVGIVAYEEILTDLRGSQHPITCYRKISNQCDGQDGSDAQTIRHRAPDADAVGVIVVQEQNSRQYEWEEQEIVPSDQYRQSQGKTCQEPSAPQQQRT